MFKSGQERTVVLECGDCKEWHDYPIPEFRRDHLRKYLRQGYITQHCGCGGKTSDSHGNTHHRVVGWAREEHKRLTPGGVKRFLGKMQWGKRKRCS